MTLCEESHSFDCHPSVSEHSYKANQSILTAGYALSLAYFGKITHQSCSDKVCHSEIFDFKNGFLRTYQNPRFSKLYHAALQALNLERPQLKHLIVCPFGLDQAIS